MYNYVLPAIVSMDKLSRLFLETFLLVMMTVVIVPVEYVHALYNHHDTEDVFEFGAAPALEQSHTHCILLKTEFRELYFDQNQPLTSVFFYLGSYYFIYQNPLLSVVSSPKTQRGPPVRYC